MSEEFEFGTFGVSELRFPTTRDSLDDSAPVCTYFFLVLSYADLDIKTEPRASDIPVFLDVGVTETIDPDNDDQAEGPSSKQKRPVSGT